MPGYEEGASGSISEEEILVVLAHEVVHDWGFDGEGSGGGGDWEAEVL